MPISKNNVLYYTEEQKSLADENSNALQYALNQGYDLERRGNYYVLREHDSMVFTPDGAWHWNSRGLHGRAQDFIVHYEGKTFVEAILTLAGELDYHPRPPNPEIHNEPSKIPKPVFEMPEKSDSSRQLFAYLCHTRGLSSQVVKDMVFQHILYQSDHTTKTGQTVHNACFVSYDEKHKPCSVFQRGLSSYGEPYKKEVPGGDKSHGWVFHGRDAEALYVCEAAIDAASLVDLGYRKGVDPLYKADYMALGGLNFSPVENYLKAHPNVRTVRLRLDNDLAGRTATSKFIPRLHELNCHVEVSFPPQGKDWNEYLQQQPLLKQVRAPPEQKSIKERIAAAKAEAASRAGPPFLSERREMER